MPIIPRRFPLLIRRLQSSSSGPTTPSLSTTPHHHHQPFMFPRVKETGFEAQWRNLSEAQRDQVEKEYIEIGKKDWHQLTFDQMRALYTIAYGAPEIKDPNETKKVVLGTAALLGASIGLFAFLRSFAKPPPETMTEEYKEATRKYLIEQNANPIRGISSKASRAKEEEDD